MQDDPGLWNTLIAKYGAAATAWALAFLGRLSWHARQVQLGKRKALSRHLLLDVPAALAIGVIGNGIASYFGLGPEIKSGLIAYLGWLGLSGADDLVREIASKGGKA